MKKYIITFDLNKPGQNYKALHDAIQKFHAWVKVATTTYVVQSNNSAIQIRDLLQKHIDKNDELFVAELTGKAAWYGLSNEVTEWLKKIL